MPPFLTIYTATHRRPHALARCLASVGEQTVADRIQHFVVVDHVGIGIGGVYAQVPTYAPAVRGEYVYLLNDDNVLASPTVVGELEAFVRLHDDPPPVIIGVVDIDGQRFPINDLMPRIGPIQSYVDLGNLIVRRDVWLDACHHYGRRYEGDFDFALYLWEMGHPFVNWPVLFATGHASHGATEHA